MDQRSFVNTRVRFQRLSDAKFFAGWVRDFSTADVLVRVKGELPVRVGDMFMFQVHGNGASAIFRGTLSVVNSENLSFSIPEPIKFLAANEEMRVTLEGITGSVTTKDTVLDAVVMDVSSKGIGLLVPESLPRGSDIQIKLDTAQGSVDCSGEVRYSKPDPMVPSQYRIGVQLYPLSRIDQARWNRLLRPEAA